MEHIRIFLHQLLHGAGVGITHRDWITQVAILLGIFVISYLATQLFRHLVMPAIRKITARTKATWDDYLFNDEMLHCSCHLPLRKRLNCFIFCSKRV